MNERSRVLVVEPHAICRRALAALVAASPEHLELSGEASSPGGAIERVREVDPDAILLGLPDLSDLDVVPRLKSITPDAGILVMASRNDGEAVFEAIRAGADGFVPEGAPPEEIIRALRVVADGGSTIHPSVVAEGFRWAAGWLGETAESRETLGRLTRREREILEMLADGLGPAPIAAELVLSRRTVESHLMSSYRKLGVHGQIEAINEYLRLKERARERIA